MVSIDHFKQELTAQMGRASASGAKDVLINSLDLSGSILMVVTKRSRAAMLCRMQ